MPSTSLPLISGASLAVFAVCVVVAGFLDPGYSHFSEGISALASTQSEAAGVMIAGFVFLGLSAITAGATIFGRLRGKAARSGAALVVLAGALTLAAGFARQSCSTLQQACLDRESAGDVTGAHVFHNLVAALAFVLFVVAMFLLASGLRRNDGFRSISRPVRIAGFFAVALLAWFISAAYGDLGGLEQRALVALIYGLPVWLAFRVTRQPAPELA